MADIVDPLALPAVTDFPRKMNAFIVEQAISPNSFTKYVTVETNIQYNTIIQFFKKMKHAMGAPIACAAPWSGSTIIDSYNKTWEPKGVSLKAQMCYQDLPNTILTIIREQGFQPYLLANSSEFVSFLSMFFTKEYWSNEQWAMYFLSDINLIAADVTSGSADLLDFYTRFDGLWKQIEAEGTDASAAAPLLTNANAQTTLALQMAEIDANPLTAVEAVKALFKKAAPDLKNRTDKIIGLTDYLWWNLKEALTQIDVSSLALQGFMYDQSTNTINVWGTPIVNLTELSTNLLDDFRIDNGLVPYDPTDPTKYKVKNPHRAYMFVKNQQWIGVDGPGMLQNFYLDRDSHTDIVKIRGQYLTDAKIGIPYLFCYAI